MTSLAIPSVGNTYNCFDDGKIRPSRLLKVKVEEVIPFNEASEETMNLWKQELEDCPWLYAAKTDFFIKAIVANGDDYDYGEQIFVRTKKQKWFSMGYWAGLLDHDGTLTKAMEKRIQNSELTK